VISGWLIGIILLIGFILLEKPVSHWWQKKKYSSQVIIAFFTSFFLIAVEVALLAGVTKWQFPESWKTTAKLNMIEQHQIIESEMDRALSINAFENAFSNGGIIFGMIAGVSMLKKMGGFIVAKKWHHRLFCYFIGLAGVMIFYLGLKMILPGDLSYGSLMLRYLRYSLIGLWISLVASLIFIRLGWATKESQN
jgi:hypothetical protein